MQTLPTTPLLQDAGVTSIAADGVHIRNFLEEVYGLAKINDLDAATDKIFDHIDRLLCDGSFAKCDEILKTVDIDRLPTALMRSFLTITLAAKNNLPARSALYHKVEQRMIELGGEEKTRKILANLV